MAIEKQHKKQLALITCAIVLLIVSSCSSYNNQLPLECTIDLVHDNMPYQDDEYVGSFYIYPRRLYLHCSIRNASNKPVSLPFRSTTDSACASCFNVKVNQSESMEVVVNERGHYDKYNIMPQETIDIQVIVPIFRYKSGELSKVSLPDLISLIELAYKRNVNDKSLSNNEMALVNCTWNKQLETRSVDKFKDTQILNCP